VRCRPALESLENRDVPTGGVLDPTFGSGGLLTTAVGSYYRTFAVATDPHDGKIVVAGGNFSSGPTLVRYNLNGTLDTSFGSGGVVAQVAGLATDVKIQPDGKIVSTNGVSVIRYNADGTFDRTFGGGKGANAGQVGTGLNSVGAQVILQADGKIVVAGASAPRKTRNYDLTLVRYNTDGTLDTTYGTGGKVIQHFASSLSLDLERDTIHLAVDPGTGKIVAMVDLDASPQTLVRFNTDGRLDTSFAGGAGYESLSSPYSPYLNLHAVAIQPDGRIVLVGTVGGTSTAGDLALERYSASGALDTTFGSGGFVVDSLPGNEFGLSLILQPDGKIVVAGTQGGYNFLVARFNAADGSPDTSFGVDGVAVSGSIQNPYQPGLPVAPHDPVYVALEPDGRIVLAGTRDSSNTGTAQFQVALARFLATGPQLGTFTASPNPATVGSSVTLATSNVVPLNPGSSVTQVAFYQDSNGDGILDAGDALLGSGTQPGTGTWTFTFSTTGWPSGATTLFAQAEDNYGVFSDPLALTLQVL
jgi:uncharacterized delta-60 repeat protein